LPILPGVYGTGVEWSILLSLPPLFRVSVHSTDIGKAVFLLCSFRLSGISLRANCLFLVIVPFSPLLFSFMPESLVLLAGLASGRGWDWVRWNSSLPLAILAGLLPRSIFRGRVRRSGARRGEAKIEVCERDDSGRRGVSSISCPF
jgi:hypothetical protein